MVITIDFNMTLQVIVENIHISRVLMAQFFHKRNKHPGNKAFAPKGKYSGLDMGMTTSDNLKGIRYNQWMPLAQMLAAGSPARVFRS